MPDLRCVVDSALQEIRAVWDDLLEHARCTNDPGLKHLLEGEALLETYSLVAIHTYAQETQNSSLEDLLRKVEARLNKWPETVVDMLPCGVQEDVDEKNALNSQGTFIPDSEDMEDEKNALTFHSTSSPINAAAVRKSYLQKVHAMFLKVAKSNSQVFYYIALRDSSRRSFLQTSAVLMPEFRRVKDSEMQEIRAVWDDLLEHARCTNDPVLKRLLEGEALLETYSLAAIHTYAQETHNSSLEDLLRKVEARMDKWTETVASMLPCGVQEDVDKKNALTFLGTFIPDSEDMVDESNLVNLYDSFSGYDDDHSAENAAAVAEDDLAIENTAPRGASDQQYVIKRLWLYAVGRGYTVLMVLLHAVAKQHLNAIARVKTLAEDTGDTNLIELLTTLKMSFDEPCYDIGTPRPIPFKKHRDVYYDPMGYYHRRKVLVKALVNCYLMTTPGPQS